MHSGCCWFKSDYLQLDFTYMKKYISQDFKNKKLFYENEYHYIIAKSMLVNNHLSFVDKKSLVKWFFFLGKTRIKLRNRCCFSGKSRSVLNRFGISRISFRFLVRQGKLGSCVKYSKLILGFNKTISYINN